MADNQYTLWNFPSHLLDESLREKGITSDLAQLIRGVPVTLEREDSSVFTEPFETPVDIASLHRPIS